VTEKAEILELHKNLGETPLECLLRYRAEHPEYKDVKMTYLGRLDPMAEGLLLVLAGNTKERQHYLDLDKTYEFEVLWGIGSDSFDILGKVEEGVFPNKLENKMAGLLKKISAKTTQLYPLFSSKSFGGDFMKARDQKIEGYDLPEKRIKIFSLEHIHTRVITGREILEEVTRRLALVKGDFRQSEVLSSWRNLLGIHLNEFYLISKLVTDVSSGTYVRGLSRDMGEILNTQALAWSIKRTRVGDFKLY
jgi:tRNA pseudouridine(55) synthase